MNNRLRLKRCTFGCAVNYILEFKVGAFPSEVFTKIHSLDVDCGSVRWFGTSALTHRCVFFE